MKKTIFSLVVLALLFVTTVISCTPESKAGNEYQDEVDKDKIERPGNQGGN